MTESIEKYQEDKKICIKLMEEIKTLQRLTKFLQERMEYWKAQKDVCLKYLYAIVNDGISIRPEHLVDVRNHIKTLSLPDYLNKLDIVDPIYQEISNRFDDAQNASSRIKPSPLCNSQSKLNNTIVQLTNIVTEHMREFYPFLEKLIANHMYDIDACLAEFTIGDNLDANLFVCYRKFRQMYRLQYLLTTQTTQFKTIEKSIENTQVTLRKLVNSDIVTDKGKKVILNKINSVEQAIMQNGYSAEMSSISFLKQDWFKLPIDKDSCGNYYRQIVAFHKELSEFTVYDYTHDINRLIGECIFDLKTLQKFDLVEVIENRTSLDIILWISILIEESENGAILL